MFMPEIEKSVFCLVDVQEKFVPAIAEMDAVTARIQVMLRAMNELKVSTIVTEQYPQGLGPTIPELKELLPAETPVISKTSFSCFGSEDFRKTIDGMNKNNLILAGIESHICLFQTAIDALEHGFKVFVAEDAISSRRFADKASAVAAMRSAGIHVMPSESIIFMLLRDAAHPSFRTISKIIR